MLPPSNQKNDRLANWLIGKFSVVVFVVVVVLGRVKLDIDMGFDIHIFALANAIINSIISVLLIGALVAVKSKKFELHRKMMFGALILSIVFLLSYILHHLLAGDTKFGGEGAIRYFYYFILITHIILAALILPFILFTAYRGLTAEWPQHRKLAKITWPLWLYVAITGPIVYIMISPYY